LNNEKCFVCIEFRLLLVRLSKAGLGRSHLTQCVFSDTKTIKHCFIGLSLGKNWMCMCHAHSSTESLPVVFSSTAVKLKDGSKAMYTFVGEIFANRAIHHRELPILQ